MKYLLPLFVIVMSPGSLLAQNEPFSMRVVNPGYQLNSAWEMLYGPDDSLWVTESYAYKVSKIDPVTGSKRELIDLSSKKNFTTSISKWPQGGLMGMALHPSMYTGWPTPTKSFVYLAYVYRYNSSAACNNGTGPCSFNTRIVRYNYNVQTGGLSNEVVLIESLAGSNDHNSGRLAVGKIDGVDYLFYTIGDMGAGQFNNASRPMQAQSQHVLEGKVLRFNLEPDADADQWDRWIPNDNPFKQGGRATAVWSTGHRNAQGLVFGSNGIAYSSEQQDRSDDEINIVEVGRNYGWPRVSGYCDGNYSGLTLAGQAVGDEIANCNTLNAVEPIYTYYTDPNPGSISGSNMGWPTIACSSIDIYENSIIPNWNQSLLVPGLKSGTIHRLKLNVDGRSVADSSSVPAMRHLGRLRDIAISPTGLKIYVSCDMRGSYMLPNGASSGGPGPYAGRILEFSYTGSVTSIGDDVRNSALRNAEFQLFPNPSTDMVRVMATRSVQKPLYYHLFDVSGKLILQEKSFRDVFDISTSKLQKGVYVLKVYDKIGRNVFTEKIVVR